MKQRLFIFLTFIMSVVALFAAGPSAASLLANLQKKMSAPAVDVVFTLRTPSGPVQGSATIAGTKVAMTSSVMCLWFDGRTQWSFAPAQRELTISEPLADELAAANPFAILSDAAANYKSRRLADLSGRYRIELTPLHPSAGITSYIISINKTTGWPDVIEANFDNGNALNIIIDKINAAKAKPASAFRYNKAAYPADEVIDLR